MIQCIVLDLSEVLIAGLVGVEQELSPVLLVPEEQILPYFGSGLFYDLLLGNVSEKAYLEDVIARAGWSIGVASLKAVIRCNFHNEVDGSVGLLRRLATDRDVVLLSDHAAEWIAYIRAIHPFFHLFKHTFFSFDLKSTKNEPGTFRCVLQALAVSPRECLFVDDNAENVGVARSVGIPSVRFVSAELLAAELAHRGVLCSSER
jgi:hypothetical protein